MADLDDLEGSEDRPFGSTWQPKGTIPGRGKSRQRSQAKDRQPSGPSPAQVDTLTGLGGEVRPGMTKGEAGQEIDRLIAERERRALSRATGEVGPDGCDAEVWEMARFFHSTAENLGVELALGLRQTYALLMNRIGKTQMRARDNWQDILRMMIAEFWENDVDRDGEAWAINQFTGREYFMNLGQWALNKLSGKPKWREMDQSYLQNWPRAKPRPGPRYPDAPPSGVYTDEEAEAIRARARAVIEKMRKEFE